MTLSEFFFEGYQNGPILIVGWQLVYLITMFCTLAWVLGRFLFKPVLAIMEEREGKIRTAQRAAREAQKRLDDSSSSGQQSILEARLEAFGLREEAQKAATGEGEAVLAKMREKVEAKISEAFQDLESDMEASRGKLKQEAGEMARSIAYRALGREEA